MARQTILDTLNLSKHYDDYVHPLVLHQFPTLKQNHQSAAAANLAGKIILGTLGAGGLYSLLLSRSSKAVDDLYGMEAENSDYRILD